MQSGIGSTTAPRASSSCPVGIRIVARRTTGGLFRARRAHDLAILAPMDALGLLGPSCFMPELTGNRVVELTGAKGHVER